MSVNVGKPEILTVWPGGPLYSAIRKRPVAGESLVLTSDNLEGDVQADRRPGVHGGPEKAILAYASEHFQSWRDELGDDLGPGAFGENLTTEGVTEAEACIGDVWLWGEALLQVSQPRGVCFKLEIHLGRKGPDGMIERTRTNGRTGWYLRVLRGGVVPAAGPIRIAHKHPARVSVLDCHRALVSGEGALRLLDLEPLSSEFKHFLRSAGSSLRAGRLRAEPPQPSPTPVWPRS